MQGHLGNALFCAGRWLFHGHLLFGCVWKRKLIDGTAFIMGDPNLPAKMPHLSFLDGCGIGSHTLTQRVLALSSPLANV